MDLIDSLGLPSRYVMGNYDIDPPKKADIPEMPFYNLARLVRTGGRQQTLATPTSSTGSRNIPCSFSLTTLI